LYYWYVFTPIGGQIIAAAYLTPNYNLVREFAYEGVVAVSQFAPWISIPAITVFVWLPLLGFGILASRALNLSGVRARADRIYREHGNFGVAGLARVFLRRHGDLFALSMLGVGMGLPMDCRGTIGQRI
jgi:hypothetical protein